MLGSSQADSKTIEAGVEQTDVKVFESGISKDTFKGMDIQVLEVKFYFQPDAEVMYKLLKQQGQHQYPHLLGYKEIDGLYTKALTTASFDEELTEWKIQGGNSPYYFKAKTHIRNNGNGALTDVKIRFIFDVKVAKPTAKSASLTTDYKKLAASAKWQQWFTRDIIVKVLPPGENRLIETENIGLCSLLEKLDPSWPYNLRVRVYASAPVDSVKNNNYASKVINLIPDHFIFRVLR